jgi:4-amino-4-deoxy-L-arabinose transferase-like glycosyltransferase
MLWHEFFVDQHLTRFTKVVLGHGAPAWFYLPILAAGLWPWFGFSLPVWWRGLFRSSRIERAGSAEASLDFFLGLWLAGSLLFFSATATKQPNYILPAVPAVIMLAARWWQDYLSGTSARPFEKWVTFGLTGSIGVVLSAFFLAVGRFLPLALEKARAGMRPDSAEYAFPAYPPDLGWGTALVGLVLAAAIFTALYFMRARRPGATFLALITGAVILIAGLTHLTAPAVFDYLQAPAREIAAQAAREAGPADRVATFGLYKPTLWFYTGLHLERIESRDREGLREFLDTEERRLVLSRLSLLERLKAQERFHLLDVKGGYVLGDNKGRTL